MIVFYTLLFVAVGLLHNSGALQSGYTCETSVTLKCPQTTKLIILEVTYSSECPTVEEMNNDGGAIYPPSKCIGYFRDRTSTQCNGQQTCTIDNSPSQQLSFFIGSKANCAFKGKSINIEYSCVPDFSTSKLPHIDICSLQSLGGLTEGFIHTPNYPSDYPSSRTCSKTIPAPPAGHRLKIYALNFDMEGQSVVRFLGITRINDWLQINNSGDKMYGTRLPYTILFDDVIEASLVFKSDFANTKRPYSGFLLYFIVTPVRVSRPPTTSTTGATTSSSSSEMILIDRFEDDVKTSKVLGKTSALVSEGSRQRSNVGLTLLVVFLCGLLLIILCAFLLYKRRNDRRVRYLTAMFNSFFPNRPKTVTLDRRESNDETILNNTSQSKLDMSTTSADEKLMKLGDSSPSLPAYLKHTNINEKHQNQEKMVFIENLKTCPSPYTSYRRSEKFNAKEQINQNDDMNTNIYSQDPVATITSEHRQPACDNSSPFYEDVNLSPQQTNEMKQDEEVIYDVVNPYNEQTTISPSETEYDSVIYATPKVNNNNKTM